jgi:hypothetical protein
MSADGAGLRWSGRLLVTVTWFSAATFGAYILAFYAGTAFDGAFGRWNETVEGLYGAETPAATLGLGLHFAAGGIILLFGPIQLMRPVRDRWPAFHRWTGRLYALAALLAGVGGLVFIATRGTVGGAPMSLLFGLYGVLMIVASVQTVRFAMLRRLDMHRAWALRLFALAIGSWLYRMEYGFWFMAVGKVGHTHQFRGWFDFVMDGFFYLPNLLLVEAWLRSRRGRATPALRIATTSVLGAASALILVATWFFTKRLWAEPILDQLSRLPL